MLQANGQCHSLNLGIQVEQMVFWEDDKFRVLQVESERLVEHQGKGFREKLDMWIQTWGKPLESCCKPITVVPSEPF